jgi:hypothetical protein
MRFTPALGFALLCWSTPGALFAESEIRVLPRTRPDRRYQLQIGLPASYKADPTRKYPVIFMTDGYFNFLGLTDIYNGLVFDKTIPEMIIVGLGYAGDKPDNDRLRMDDLLPMSLQSNLGIGGLGQAEEYLHMIETVAIPLMEKDYRADPKFRVLMGTSAGGLFTLYALFTKPQLFQGYVAAAPFVAQLWQYEDDFARSGQSVGGRVFITSADRQFPSYDRNIILFSQRLAQRSYLKGGFRYRNIDGMRHASEEPESYARGLQYVCEPIAPQTGVSTDLFPSSTQGFFEIQFKGTPALKDESQWSPEQKEVMRRHRLMLDQLMKEKKVELAMRTPDGSARTYSVIQLLARDQKEAESFAAADPAVAAGLMTFEVIQLSGARP